MFYKIVLGISALVISSLLYVGFVQDTTIRTQTRLMHAMESNPACMIDPVKAQQDFMTLQRKMQRHETENHVTEN